MRGTISREHPWEVMPDLYFYRDPEEVSSAIYTAGAFQIPHLAMNCSSYASNWTQTVSIDNLVIFLCILDFSISRVWNRTLLKPGTNVGV